MDADQAIPALSALAHPMRLEVFRLLVRAGDAGLAAGEIARTLNVLPNTLSANLNILSGAGLVRARRDGRQQMYSVEYGRVTALLSFLMEDCCSGRPEICGPLTTIAQSARDACCDEAAA